MLDSVANFIKLIVSTGYDQNATSITLHAGGSSLPAAPFNTVWWNSSDFSDPSTDPNVEIVRVTNISGNILTIVRAQEGTTASTKNTGGKTYTMVLAITAKMIADINANLQKPWQYVNVEGVIDGNNTVFTITPIPADSNSVTVRLARQPQEQGIDYTLSDGTITYISPPDGSLADQPHVAQYQ
jgi:hypothetical protein